MYQAMIITSLLAGLGTGAGLCLWKKVPKRFAGYLLILVTALVLYLAVMVTFINSGGKAIGLNVSGGAAGLVLGVVIMSLITPEYKRAYAESFFVVLPLMYGIGKIGCSFAGCCAGLPYHGAFSVIGKEGTAVFPVQALEAVVFLSLFLLSIILEIKNRYNPKIMLIVYALAKIGLDFLRDTHIDHIISRNQVMGTLLIIVFVIYYFWDVKRDTVE